MPAVQVHKDGELLGRVKVGETRNDVFNRFSIPDHGFGLFDNGNFALRGDEQLRIDGGPYVLKETVRLGQPSTSSSSPKRQRTIRPPSEGKMASIQPSSIRNPSSEEGQRDAMKYVDEAADLEGTHALQCSANSTVLYLTSLLENEVNNREQIPQKYKEAAKSFLTAREMLDDDKLDSVGVKGNERHFTGAFCLALNAVLSDGMAALHQGCIGTKATHSDVHARYMLDNYKSPVLMVGEGKLGSHEGIRKSVRGQLFNELIRHRKIDRKARQGNADGDYRPILLMSFNTAYISLELAFPSTKNGHMENLGWVSFNNNLREGTETFWTVQVAMVGISGTEGNSKIPVLLRFIELTLWHLQQLRSQNTSRVQFKTPWKNPWPTDPEVKVTGADKRGANVTIIKHGERKFVRKEFCYYLRKCDGFNFIGAFDEIEERDQRWVPNEHVLNDLGKQNEWYRSWKVEAGPFGIKILVYEFRKGSLRPPSKDVWIQVLRQVDIIHSHDFVHGDLLPRNLLFSEEYGLVIDFDLMRKEGGEYVLGYNQRDFAPYRHSDARARTPMKKEHDIHALVQLSKEYFVLPSDWNKTTILEMIEFFDSNVVKPKTMGVDFLEWEDGVATDSPRREDTGASS